MNIDRLIKTLVESPYDLTVEDFFSVDIDHWNNILVKKDYSFWEGKGREMALNLFHTVSKRVPAYKDFLKENNVNPADIRTIEDFALVPTINKKNYLKKYPLKDLCIDGNLNLMQTISVSSGSTGHPFFWPRSDFQEFDTSLTHELFLKKIFKVDKKQTLVVIAYSMGMYVAGPFTFSSTQRVSQKGYPVTVVTPGINKVDVVRVLETLAPQYEQVIIAGYPPFVKDILEDCKDKDIDLSKLNLKFIFGAESFSEEWRSNIFAIIQAKQELSASMNTYGSADAAILGHETSLTVLLRKTAKKTNLENNLFLKDEQRLPSLHQYNPLLRFFEVTNDNNLIFTAASGIPLIRYEIGDYGGIVSYSKAKKWLDENQNALPAEKLEKESLWQLPLVYLYGRKDFTVTLYGLNLYPENIKDALIDSRINKMVTGKFVMSQEYDLNHNQYILLKLEAKTIEDIDIHLIQDVIVEILCKVNREYDRLYSAMGDKVKPVIDLGLKGDTRIFSEGVKQKWVKN